MSACPPLAAEQPAAPRLLPAIAHAVITPTLLIILVVGAIAIYHRTVVRPALVIGLVDVSEVYRAKEGEFTQLLTRASSAEDRQKALAMARGFSQRLPRAIDELSAECGCLVLVKSAVAGAPHGRDLTPLLRQKLEQP
jgi:hypothetical protein